MLKHLLQTLDGLDESLKPLYKQNEDGTFTLQVEGLVPKEKVDEFRTNNIDLKKQLEELQTTYKDVNLDELKAQQELARKVREKELIEKGDVDTLIAERVKGLTTDYDAKLADKDTKLQVATSQLESLLIDNVLRKLATEKGVLPTAVDDVLLRGRSVFKLKDGVPTAFDDSGNVRFGRDAVNPLSVEEWFGTLRESATHLFHQPKGSGANNNPTPGQPTNMDPNKSSTQKIADGLSKINS